MEDCFVLDNPILVVSNFTVEKYRYELRDLKPHLEVFYQIWCYDSKNEFIKILTGKIEGEEYSAWSSDDNYIDDLIKSKVIQYFSNL